MALQELNGTSGSFVNDDGTTVNYTVTASAGDTLYDNADADGAASPGFEYWIGDVVDLAEEYTFAVDEPISGFSFTLTDAGGTEIFTVEIDGVPQDLQSLVGAGLVTVSSTLGDPTLLPGTGGLQAFNNGNNETTFTFNVPVNSSFTIGHNGAGNGAGLNVFAQTAPVAPAEPGPVDGEEFGEVMTPGYNDDNAPTDGGGDIIDGPDGLDDTIFGNGGNDTIDAGLGNDSVEGGCDDDTIDGGTGNDTIFGDGSSSGSTQSTGGEFNQFVTGTAGTINYSDGSSVSYTTTASAGDVVDFLGSGDTGFYQAGVNNGIQFQAEFNTWEFSEAVEGLQLSAFGMDSGDNFDIWINGQLFDINAALANGDATLIQQGNAQIDAGGGFFNNALIGPDFSDPTILQINVPITTFSVNHPDTNGSGFQIALQDQIAVEDDCPPGDDSIEGGTGDDVIYGDNGDGGTPVTVRESFEWDQLPDPNGSGSIDNDDPVGTVTQDTGNVNVTFQTLSSSGANTVFGTDQQFVAGIDGGGETVSTTSGLDSDLTPSSDGSAEYRLSFDQEVQNVDFRINDVDGSAEVTVRAFDADGNELPVEFDLGSNLTSSGANGFETASGSIGDYGDVNDPDFSALVQIAGPVAHIEITHDEGSENSGVWITDVYYDAPTGEILGGDDTIEGGAGDDEIFGEAGDDSLDGGDNADSIEGGTGDDTIIAGTDDSIDGGDDRDLIIGDQSALDDDGGPASGTIEITGGAGGDDFDTLDLTDFASAEIISQVTDSDGNGSDYVIEATNDDGRTVTVNADNIEELILPEGNQDPTANPDTATTTEEEPVTIDVLANDTDPDGDTLALDSFTQPLNGTVTQVGDELVYTPDAGFVGNDQFTYTVDDGNGGSETATVSVRVDEAPNEAPTAVDDTITVDEDDSVTFDPTGNDTDPDGDPVTVDSFEQPDSGTVTQNPDGTLTYTPDPDFNGPDTFEVTVTDPDGLTSTSTVTVNVTPVNDAPDAVNDTAETDEETPVVIDVLGNDTDVDGDDLTITAATVPTEQGTVEIVTENGVDALLFTPAEDFFGEATISYSITDGNGGTDVAEAVVTVNNINDDPVAVDDIAETEEDTPVVVDLLGNDEDVDGDPLTIASVSVPPEQGTVVDNGDGTVTFTPAPNFNGPATITYVVDDGQGGTDEGEATVSVSSVIDPPVANDDTAETDEDTPVTIDVLANDTDPDNTTDELTITAATVPADQGTVEIVGNELVFTPAENFNGDATISYSIADPDGGTSTAEVAVTVNPVNDDPIALDDIENTDEDQPVIVDLLGNDSDVDGDPLTIGSLSVDPAEGSVVDNGDGTVTFTPAPDFNGPATITYTVEDGQGGSDEGQAVVNVGAVNDSPVAEDDASTTLEDTPVTFDVLANDGDVDGDPISVVSATVTEGEGTVAENADGTLTYTPAPDFNGTAVVTYTITDGNGLNDTAEWTITVTPDDDAPVTVDDTAETDEDTPVIIDPLANDSDPDGDPLTIGEATSPDGDVTINPDGTITFTPDPDFNGPTTIEYTAVDPDGNETPGTITVDVVPVNDPPDAVNDLFETDEEVPVTLDVLANDTDVDGDPLTITGASVPADQGTVEIVNNELLYTPADDFFGTATISYAIEDGNGGTDTAVAEVVVNNVNDDPIAVDDLAETEEDTPVVVDLLGNDTDVDGDPLTLADVSVPPEQGTVVDNGDGTVTFTPAPNFNGPATITYTVDDGAGGTDEGQAVVSVSSVIDPPVANDDTAETDEDTPVTIDVLANDTDPDNTTDELTITAATVPADQGTVEIVNDQLVFTPAENFNGDVTISYSIADPDGGTSSAEVAVTVNPINDDPIAVDDIETTDEDVPVIVDLLGNDTDVDGDPLTISSLSVDPAEGSVVDNGDGTVTFTPAPNYNGPAVITYEVSDGNGGTDTGEAVVSVGAVNDAPEADDDADVTEQATPVTVDVLANDSDPDGDALEVISATVPADQGTVVNNGDGTVTFTPAQAFVGTAVVSYTISDGNGGTANAEVSIVVTDVIGPVDGTDEGQVMDPGFEDADGDEVDGDDGLNDTIFGNGGDDTIDAGDGDDTVDGGDDDDLIDGGDGDDMIMGGDGSDTLAGNEGDDTLDGGDGDDDIAVGGGDEADGGDGDDVFTIDPTDPATDVDVTLDGGSDGTDGAPAGPENGDEGDILDLSDRPEDLDVILEPNPETGTVDGLDTDGTPDIAFEEIEKIITGSGDDTVDGGDAEDPIDVTTGDGDDSVTGGDGDDVIDTGGDDDTVESGDGNDSVDGGDGDNVIDTSGNNFNDPITGQPISGAPDRGYPGLFPGDSDPFDDRDTVTTGDGDDTITTGDDNDIINAGDGDNVIDAGFDDDTITTGDGDDLIVAGEGSDSILAGAGNDTIYAANDPSVPDSVNIPDADLGGLSPDLVPDNGTDFVDAGAGDDLVFGADDDDTLIGGTGDDTLDGGIDDDTLEGDEGDDVLIGGQGADTMDGGDGEDTFLVDGPGDGIGDVIDGGSGGAPVAADDPTTPGEDWDVLDLRGSAPVGGSLQVTETGPDSNGNGIDGFVTYFDADGNEVGTLDFAEIEEVIPCFTPGTLIATPRGEVRVEELEVGDRVITRDNGIQEIRWVGCRQMTPEELAAQPRFKPVMIKRGALGNGLPERDMMVSPNHRVLLASEQAELLFEEREVLVAVKHLIGMAGIDWAAAHEATYIHIMFDQHEVILSDGAWTESFQPGDMSLKGVGTDQREELLALFPELETRVGIDAYAAARRILKKHEAALLRH